MPVVPAEIKECLKQLAATPRRLASLSTGLKSARLHSKPDEDTWSANDILAHLRACADVWGKSMRLMMTQDHPTLRYISPRTWMRKTDYADLEFDVSLQAFTQQRAELLKALKALEIENWLRGATFTATTRGREQTILSYARRMAQHEIEHCDQIEALLQ